MKNLVFTILIVNIYFGIGVNEQKANPDSLHSGPGIYKIIGVKKDPIVIPFNMHHGKPLMNLKINGEDATLMIDNGVLWDQVWLFGSPLVKKLQLQPTDTSSIGGAGESNPTAAYSSFPIVLKFKDIIFYRQPVLVSPPAAGFAKMFPGVDGQLCNTFFKNFIVEFDFEKNQVLLHNPKNFQYMGGGSVLDMRKTTTGTHAVPFSFTTEKEITYSDWVDLDFGGIYPVKIALNNKYKIQLPENAEEVSMYGAQGKIPSYKGKIKNISIGKYTFENVPVVFGDSETSGIHPENLGVIGLPLFRKFRIIFDYINYKLYLEPNKNFDTPFDQ